MSHMLRAQPGSVTQQGWNDMLAAHRALIAAATIAFGAWIADRMSRAASVRRAAASADVSRWEDEGGSPG